jgi:peptidoglycan/LPS O-acetylase OafA/YrhL
MSQSNPDGRPGEAPRFVEVPGSDARAVPVRLLLVQGEARPPVDVTDEPMVMTFPHLLLRELVAFVVLSLVLALLALFVDAPLEELANPDKTPNPAKAPWYFLGLQELLHYYPPIVSGVVLPGLLVIALAVIPYFDVNIERAAPWRKHRGRKLALLWLTVGALVAVFATTGAHPVWPLIGPALLVALLMTWAAALAGGDQNEDAGQEGGAARWLRTRSFPFWIFTWFLLASVVLTVIGVFFRGPGWTFTLPWRDGVF